MGLASDYSPTRVRLKAHRDEVERSICPPEVQETVHYLVELNHALGDHAANFRLFTRWQSAPLGKRRELNRILWMALIEGGFYREGVEFEGDILSSLQMEEAAESRPPERVPSPHYDDIFGLMTKEAAFYLTALVEVGRDEAAELLIEKWKRVAAGISVCYLVEPAFALLGEVGRDKLMALAGENCRLPAPPMTSSAAGEGKGDGKGSEEEQDDGDEGK